MSLLTAHVRAAENVGEVDAAFELAAHVFGPSYESARAAKARSRELDPVDDLRDILVAEESGEIVGLVRIVDRTALVGRSTLRIGGVTSVAVRSDRRGEGYGRLLMEAAVQRSVERRDVLSIAFARRAVDGFYWRLGYVGIGSHHEMAVDRRSSTPANRGAAVVPGFKDDLAATYATAYRDSYGSLFLSFERDGRWWSQGRKRIEARDSSWLFQTLYVGTEPVGYLVIHDSAIIEAAALHQHERGTFEALMTTPSVTGESLQLRLSPEHWLSAACRGVPHSERIRFSWDGGHVARLIDPDAFRSAAAADATAPRSIAGSHTPSTTSHAAAREALFALVGVTPPKETPDQLTVRMEGRTSLDSMPCWSPIDEF